MRRVASLYLPNFPIERIRRIDAQRRREATPECGDLPLLAALEPRGLGWRPGARWARETPPVTPAKAGAHGYGSTEIASKPQSTGPGFRRDDERGIDPADRWMAERHRHKAAMKAEIEARIGRLPLHQRPPMRELGRRSEAAEVPFKAGPRDEAAELAAPDLSQPAAGQAGRHIRYDLLGAFWHTGRTVAPQVARGIAGEIAPPRPAPTPLPPLVTALRDGQKLLVAAACPAARAAGVTPGMALTFARALVPGLDVRDADPDGDAADLDRLARHAARHWTPHAAVVADGLRLDLTGVAHLHGCEARFCARALNLLARLGCTARIAVADTFAAAHALARHAAEVMTICPAGRQSAAVAALPLVGLELDHARMDALQRLGVTTIGALAALPRAPLVRRFGRAVADRLDALLGARAEPIEPVVPDTPISAGCRFAEPIGTAEAIADAIAHLLSGLVRGLRERGLGARAIELRCERVDCRAELATIGTARPSRDMHHLHRLLTARIETIDPGFGIEAMRLVATATERMQPTPIGDAVAATAPDLAELVDLLATRLGRRRLFRLREVESELPERSAARTGPLGAAAAWRDAWPRPIRLLDPPEPIEHVVAELPDHPPRRFRWRGRLHAVRHGDGPERIHAEWWRDPDRADAVRDYFAVEDDCGARFWLFRQGDGADGRTGDLSWHMQGLFG